MIYMQYVVNFQGEEDLQNYGIDWEENAGEVEPDLVEVPQTKSGLSEAQVDTIMTQIPENISIDNAVEVFINILYLTMTFLENDF